MILDTGYQEQRNANRFLQCLARIRDLMYGRDEMAVADAYFAVSGEIMVQYQRLTDQRQKLHREMERLSALSFGVPLSSPPGNMALHTLRKTYGVILLFSIFLNRALRAFDAENTELATESDFLVQEILINAGQFAEYKPMGASWIVLALSAAWIGTDDPSLKLRVQTFMSEFQWSVGVDICVLERISQGFRELAKRRAYKENSLSG